MAFENAINHQSLNSLTAKRSQTVSSSEVPSLSLLENPSHFLSLDALQTVLDNLKANAPVLREQYLKAQPHPHLILQDLFPPNILEQIAEDFPKLEERDWITWDTRHELKSTSRGIQNLSLLTQLFSLWLNSSNFIQALESIVGVDASF